MPEAALRRSVAINVAHGNATAHCADCEARHIGMCDALTDDEISFLARTAQRTTVAAGKVFIAEQEPAAYFYNISAGNVRVFKSLPDGRRHITGFMGVGQFLGLDVAGSYAFSAEAMGEVQLCRFHRKSLHEVFGEFPVLERRLLNIATHELTVAHDQMLLLGRKTAQERVATFLMTWAERNDHCPAGGVPKPDQKLPLPMTRIDLADYLGLTIETVSRSLSAMKRDGLIALDHAHEVLLLKPQRLADIAAGAT